MAVLRMSLWGRQLRDSEADGIPIVSQFCIVSPEVAVNNEFATNLLHSAQNTH